MVPTGSFAHCIDTVLASPAQPFLISDSSDNQIVSRASDVTWGLTELPSRPKFQGETGPIVIYASVLGPDAIGKSV